MGLHTNLLSFCNSIFALFRSILVLFNRGKAIAFPLPGNSQPASATSGQLVLGLEGLRLTTSAGSGNSGGNIGSAASAAAAAAAVAVGAAITTVNRSSAGPAGTSEVGRSGLLAEPIESEGGDEPPDVSLGMLSEQSSVAMVTPRDA
ncbi:unnamed protein product, partial [Protopolystoma xenopodis]